ncbi:MAG: peptidylprolyl isomerase [Planctomycetota bacterium]|jgi:hypothetical protein
MTAKGLWKWFRRHEKMILAAIVVLIVPAFGFGSILVASVARQSEPTTAAKIDGVEISYQDLQKLKQRFLNLVQDYIVHFAKPRARGGSVPKVGNNDLFKHVRLVKEARDVGIRVTEGEIDEVITKWPTTSMTYPFLLSAEQFLTQQEKALYFETLRFQLQWRILPRQGAFSPTQYAQYLSRMHLTESDFRKTVEEILAVLKFKYFLWSSTVVSTDRAYERYAKENVKHRCAYVRFDASDFKIEGEEVDRETLVAHYGKNQVRYQEPHRKQVEFFHVQVEDIKKRVKKSVTEEEMRAFYEREKEVLFRAPVEKKEEKEDEKEEEEKKVDPGEEKKGDEAKEEEKKEQPEKKEEKKEQSGEKKAGGNGSGNGGAKGAQKPPEKAGEKKAAYEKKDVDKEKDADEKKDADKDKNKDATEKKEPEPVKVLPFKDVRDTINERLTEQKAQDYLSNLMGKLVGRIRGLERGIREDPGTFRDRFQALRTEIDLVSIRRNLAASDDWTRPYKGFRVGLVQDDRFLSREELRGAFGVVGPRIADAVFSAQRLQISDVTSVPGGFISFRVVDERHPITKPFEEIQDQVRDDYFLGKGLERALEKAKEVRGKMTSSSFEEAVREANLKTRETGFFGSRDAEVPGTGDHPAVGAAKNFIAAAFSVETEPVSRPVQERELGSVFLLKVLKRKKPGPAEMKAVDRDRLLEQERKGSWAEVNRPWGEQFKKNHEIIDKTRDRK